MSKDTFQKSIAATLGAAVVSAGLFVSISSYAQNGTPGTTTTPSGTTTTPTTKPAGGTMTPGTMTPGTMTPGTMTPGTTTPGTTTPGTMTPGTTTPGTMTPGTTTPSTSTPKGKTIVSIASGNKNFTTLVKALKAADLVETLSGEGPYTVFAPTNAAFNKLPKATLNKLLKNKEQLKKVLTYHVVSGAVTSKALKSGSVATVEGSNVNVKIRGKNIRINNNAKVISPYDVKASNGVIHAIDTVLTPPTK